MESTTGRIAIGADDKTHLKRAAKWAKFLAIVQFVCLGLMVPVVLFMIFAGGALKEAMSHSHQYDALPGGFFTGYGVFWAIALVVSFFLALLLYRFAKKTLQAVAEGNDAVMTEAFENLGKYFRLYGIVTIVALALCALAIVGVIIAAIAAAAML